MSSKSIDRLPINASSISQDGKELSTLNHHNLHIQAIRDNVGALLQKVPNFQPYNGGVKKTDTQD